MSLPSEGRLAGIDYGHVRIGIAVCDPQQRLASPLENYTRSGSDADGRRFRRLVEEEQLVGFVVGLPVHASGDESQKSAEARRFGQWLETLVELPVAYHDERYTSVEAERALQDAGLTKKRRQQRLDMLAAQLILAGYLESSRRDLPPAGLES